MDAEEDVERESLSGIISLIRTGCNIPNSIKGVRMNASIDRQNKISNQIVQIIDL